MVWREKRLDISIEQSVACSTEVVPFRLHEPALVGFNPLPSIKAFSRTATSNKVRCATFALETPNAMLCKRDLVQVWPSANMIQCNGYLVSSSASVTLETTVAFAPDSCLKKLLCGKRCKESGWVTELVNRARLSLGCWLKVSLGAEDMRCWQYELLLVVWQPPLYRGHISHTRILLCAARDWAAPMCGGEQHLRNSNDTEWASLRSRR